MRGAWIGLLLLASAGGALAQDAALPVGVGGGEGNACVAQGKATGPLDVHVGPGDTFEVYDHLSAGETVFLCESDKGWYGIVYGKGDCGVSKPMPARVPYIGACKTGWVTAKSLATTAE